MSRDIPTPPACAPPPWWLGHGDEACPQCGQAYAHEHERRCAGCDAPSCMHCVDRRTGLCAECLAEGAAT